MEKEEHTVTAGRWAGAKEREKPIPALLLSPVSPAAPGSPRARQSRIVPAK